MQDISVMTSVTETKATFTREQIEKILLGKMSPAHKADIKIEWAPNKLMVSGPAHVTITITTRRDVNLTPAPVTRIGPSVPRRPDDGLTVGKVDAPDA